MSAKFYIGLGLNILALLCVVAVFRDNANYFNPTTTFWWGFFTMGGFAAGVKLLISSLDDWV